MLNVAMVGPLYNGLNRYMGPLTLDLRSRGINIKRLGFDNICFDKVQIEKNVKALVKELEKGKYDIIHYNYGTYDAEQLIPIMINTNSSKQILTVHSTNWGLFKKIQEPRYYEAVNSKIFEMDGYIFFTKYAMKRLKFQPETPWCIAWHPATHEGLVKSKENSMKELQRLGIESERNITVLGYASHWKNPEPVLKVARVLPEYSFIFAGQYWSQKIKSDHIPSNVKIVDREMTEDELVALIDSSVGVFPYQDFPSFQGSGLLPNYLARKAPVVISKSEPLIEYTVGMDCSVDINDTMAFAEMITRAVNMDRESLQCADFSYKEHGRKISELYKKVMET